MDKKALAITDSIGYVLMFLGMVILFLLFYFIFRIVNAKHEAEVVGNNMDTTVALSAQMYLEGKYLFDLNSDGKKEEVTRAVLLAYYGKNTDIQELLKNETELYFNSKLGNKWSFDIKSKDGEYTIGHNYGDKIRAGDLLFGFFPGTPVIPIIEKNVRHVKGYLPSPEGSSIEYNLRYWVMLNE